MRALALGSLVLLFGCKSEETRAWERELDGFHAERTHAITTEWLTLIGRFELKRGENSVGGGEAAIKLPGVEGVLGIVTVGDDITWSSGGQVTVMEDDSAGQPTIIEHGALRLHVIKRGDLFILRVKDLKSHALAKFSGLSWFPAAAKWKVNATFEPAAAGSTIEITNVLNQTTPQASPGHLVFDVEGKTYRLAVLTDGEPGYFVIFKDETSGHGTYPAGRFLHTPAPSEGHVVLDFNRAYSPPCAFTNFATCPLPPKENHLPLKIEAGERDDAH